MKVTVVNHFKEGAAATFSGEPLEVETKLRYRYGLLLVHVPQGDLESVIDELGRCYGLEVSTEGFDPPCRFRKMRKESVDPRDGDP